MQPSPRLSVSLPTRLFASRLPVAHHRLRGRRLRLGQGLGFPSHPHARSRIPPVRRVPFSRFSSLCTPCSPLLRPKHSFSFIRPTTPKLSIRLCLSLRSCVEVLCEVSAPSHCRSNLQEVARGADGTASGNGVALGVKLVIAKPARS
jgi:hypothetical protein